MMFGSLLEDTLYFELDIWNIANVDEPSCSKISFSFFTFLERPVTSIDKGLPICQPRHSVIDVLLLLP